MLRDALDGAALARGIAALEQHHDSEFFSLHPILQLHQFALQPEQFLEIDLAIDGLALRVFGHVVEQRVQALVIHFQLKLFVETISDIQTHALAQIVRARLWLRAGGLRGPIGGGFLCSASRRSGLFDGHKCPPAMVKRPAG